MKVVIDIEANSLKKPSQIWLVVAKDLEKGAYHIFRNVTNDERERERFIEFFKQLTYIVGHNYLGYDGPVLSDLLGINLDYKLVLDTLIVSKLVDYSRKGHSIEQYGKEFGIEKIDFNDFKQWSQEMEDYCIRDVDICELIYRKYQRIIDDPNWHPSLEREHKFQLRVNDLEENGFYFDRDKASALLSSVSKELEDLDEQILEAFPPRQVLVREFTPKATKHGTISKTSVPRQLWDRIHEYEIGRTYAHTREEPFNPDSHKQIIQVLTDSGWSPAEKTQSHLDCERELRILKFKKNKSEDLIKRIEELSNKLKQFQITGWKVNEANLSTLPDSAPDPARLLAKRILLESRRRSLTEWLSLLGPDGRIHGKFYGIGAWTHRMAHQQPNTANIPSEYKEDGSKKLLGKEMRQLWRAPKKKMLVGVDAEGIQLRIFAHYINDPEFTDALVRGKKSDETDPHSLNRRILGSVCKSRQAAKRFIYALLLGAGMGKLAQVLEASTSETQAALDRLLVRYSGFARLKKEVIPSDASMGWFLGLDGRKVAIPGDSPGERRHLCMSGYLQNGEAIVVKDTVLRTCERLEKEDIDATLVNVVHDEVIFEVPNAVYKAKYIGEIFCEEIKNVGEELKLLCPLAGDAKTGLTWYDIH